MHILWINERASFVGGCEFYIFRTVQLLKQKNIRSTLLYNPCFEAKKEFLDIFEEAFPLVDLEKQLKEIHPDLIYVHQLYDDLQFDILASIGKPTIRFFHDHHLVPKANKKLDAFVMSSESMAQEAISNDFPKEKIHMIPLFSLEPEKHIEALIELFHSGIANKTPTQQLQQNRFTVAGSEKMENRLSELISEVVTMVRNLIDQSHLQVLLLIGGYGRGEGGVEVRNGEEYPHNNLDFLLITKGIPQAFSKKIKSQLDNLLIPISQKYEIGFDTSVLADQKLKNSPHLLIWYEMMHGYRLLLGNSKYLSSLPFEDSSKISPNEFFALLVNRGTLLIINEWLLETRQELAPTLKKAFIKHMIKAIIGFGDVLLYFLDDYHWSYQEKQRRMRKHLEVSEKFRQLYEEATQFRFSANYELYLTKDLRSWIEEVKSQIAEIFLYCERKRLHQLNLSWDNYIDASILTTYKESKRSWYGIKGHLKALLNPSMYPVGATLQAKLAFCLLTPNLRRLVLFPVLAFGIGDEDIHKQVKKFLHARSSEPADLRLAYLQLWNRYGDLNFSRSLKEWGLSLDYEKNRNFKSHSPPSIAVLMRTKNAESILPQTLKALFSQHHVSFDLHVVDSSSTDRTLDMAKFYPCQIEMIEAKEYFPGKVLNAAIKKIQADIIVFLNSDTVLLDSQSLFQLLKEFENPEVQAAFGRQLPRPDAETWVRRDYQASFPDTNIAPSWMHLSLSFSAMRKSIWEKRPFYESAWGSEDNEWGYWAKSAGYQIAYVPKALVMHSHNYTLRQLYGRRFIEGEADAYIYKHSYTLPKMLFQWVKSLGRDVLFYIHAHDWLGLPKLPILRFVYFWAYFQGHRLGQKRRISNDQDSSQGQKTVLNRYN